MTEKEKIDSILDSVIACKGECENCLASQKFEGMMLCHLLAMYRDRLIDAIIEIVEKM